MRFNFQLAGCARNNSDTAKLRESLRLGCIALGMEQLGQDVVITNAPPVLMKHPRWFSLRRLVGDPRPGIEVAPAEDVVFRKGIDVAFKCSVGVRDDRQKIDGCRLLVAHEYDQSLDTDPRLLPVPFMVHDSVMDLLLDDGMFKAFIQNNVQEIRSKYCRKKTGLLGLRACVHYSRRKFCEDSPEWADIDLYEVQSLTPREHVPWISGFIGGLCLSGTTPKTNLPSLLALLGVAIVAQPLPQNCRDTPSMSEANAVMFSSWDQVKGELQNESRIKEIVAQATRDYVECWSPRGQARLILERMT